MGNSSNCIVSRNPELIMNWMSNLVWAISFIFAKKFLFLNELDNPVGFSNFKGHIDDSYDFIIGQKYTGMKTMLSVSLSIGSGFRDFS